MQDSKEEKEFRNDFVKAMQESNALFAESMKAMSSSMVALAQSLQKSTEMMSQEQIPREFPNQYQHMPYVYQNGNYINHQDMGMMGRPPMSNQKEEEHESDIYMFN